ncbi:MAG: 2-succinyl-5-enolpyruvyl-6-hydroxy-3-cyclohexene-1-carboxylic-acid synthase [Candidatus Binataceae bacterium]
MSRPSNPNVRAACAIAEELRRSGVTDACISPGSRSTAMVLGLLRAGGVRPWVILDERCAAFFALGMARESGRPVVLLCTSGTAAANYMPAIAEASLEQVPLVAITADRPPELRDCHAPQTIDQVRLYTSHVRWAVDAPAPESGRDLEAYYRTLACRAVGAATGTPHGPVQINLPMREPLIDVDEELKALAVRRPTRDDHPPYTAVHRARAVPSAETIKRLADKLGTIERGLILCGPGSGYDLAPAVARIARRLGWPLLADPLSGLRYGRHDRELVVDAYDVILRDRCFAEAHQPDAVLQFGHPPVSKPLVQFLGAARRLAYLVVAPAGEWPEPLHVATDVVHGDPGEFFGALAELLEEKAHSHWAESWLRASSTARAALDADLAREAGMFEGKVFAETLKHLPPDAILHVGNSMPVRDLDTFLGGAPHPLAIYCNRGANGIDGVMSAAMGAAAVHAGPTVLVLGDLSFLHDLGALQIAARYPLHIVIVVLNNDGGGIFSFLPQSALGDTFERFFGTPHGLSPGAAVTMCGGSYRRAASWDEFGAAMHAGLADPGLHVIEIPGDRARNLARHREIVGAALEALRVQIPTEGT